MADLKDAGSLAAGVRDGNRRAVARLVTLVESDDPLGHEALALLHDRIGDAHVVGVTGSPGSGKSTLVDSLIGHYRDLGKRVGVVAVDPSSPFTGGAILGDRIRMQSRSSDPEVFIRSMGTRGTLGGLSAHTHDAVRVMDAAGCDVVLVETVGVGQAEVDVVRLADTVVLVLVPNMGDGIQAVKAGVMEIADLFVVNKADLQGSDRVHAEVEAALGLDHPGEEDWWPPILRTRADKGEGVEELAEAVEAHRKWSREHGEWVRRRRRRLHEQVRALLCKRVLEEAFAADGSPRDAYRDVVESAWSGDGSPHHAVEAILERLRQGGP